MTTLVSIKVKAQLTLISNIYIILLLLNLMYAELPGSCFVFCMIVYIQKTAGVGLFVISMVSFSYLHMMSLCIQRIGIDSTINVVLLHGNLRCIKFF